MPREVIKRDHGNIVEVSWGSGGTVQVSTYSPDRMVASTIEAKSVDEAKSAILVNRDPNAMQGPAGPTDDIFTGWYVDLDREGINRFIRLLRRARDNAYGADA